jgi:uncharacterized protein
MSDQHDAGWANPMPAGLIALSIAVFIFYAVLTGKVGKEAMPIAGIWLIGGFFVQVIVGVIELRLGSSAGGNTFTWFSAYFMLVTGVVWIFQYFAGMYGWKLDPHIAGWTWLAITLVLWLEFPAFAKTMPLTVFLVIVPMNLSLPIITGMNLGLLDHHTYAPIAGNMAGIAGLLAIYSAAAVQINTVFGKPVFPFPGPILK